MSNSVSVKVVAAEGMPIERTLKKFKRMCENYGITKEYRKRKHYSKPSILKKEKLENAQKRRIKLQKKSFGRYSKI
ncbi:ribosomal protein S21 [Bacteriovorax sp. BSW11_IV]|uniref:30S ribosomal protein S21 n=1 Tax=Bacteriovorax sp. BSW11_IV TaxID=1353529 RepID=UPI000389E040|nr:30S ribosomal protein S21 [Bacteriovorax sp. BSW11_IV]EQC47809.1 ribosomal protein S21 [Bacteriovorax sp. BSW11_IV]